MLRYHLSGCSPPPRGRPDVVVVLVHVRTHLGGQVLREARMCGAVHVGEVVRARRVERPRLADDVVGVRVRRRDVLAPPPATGGAIGGLVRENQSRNAKVSPQRNTYSSR